MALLATIMTNRILMNKISYWFLSCVVEATLELALDAIFLPFFFIGLLLEAKGLLASSLEVSVLFSSLSKIRFTRDSKVGVSLELCCQQKTPMKVVA